MASAQGIATDRRGAFVSAAREAFFAHGFAGTTMSSIAVRVGGSKTTLWTYFPSKHELFVAVVDDLLETYGTAIDVPMDVSEPLDVALKRFATGMMAIVLSPPILALHRLVIGEAGRFPELGEVFFDRGPKRGKDKLAAYLENAMKRGIVRKGNPARATRQYAAMCQCGVYQHALLGSESTTAAEVEADIDAAIASFIAAWGSLA